MVQTGVGSPALHATACADPGQRDEDERSHEHKNASPLLTLLFKPDWSCKPLLVCYSKHFVLAKFPCGQMCKHFHLTHTDSDCLQVRGGLLLWAVKWCLWTSALKAGGLLAQTGCPHHSSPRSVEMSRPWRQRGIYGNSLGRCVMFLYHPYYCRFHPGS